VKGRTAGKTSRMGKIPFTFGQDCLFFQIERKPGKKDQNFQKNCKNALNFQEKTAKMLRDLSGVLSWLPFCLFMF